MLSRAGREAVRGLGRHEDGVAFHRITVPYLNGEGLVHSDGELERGVPVNARCDPGDSSIACLKPQRSSRFPSPPEHLCQLAQQMARRPGMRLVLHHIVDPLQLVESVEVGQVMPAAAARTR